jgi:hypothetical protein
MQKETSMKVYEILFETLEDKIRLFVKTNGDGLITAANNDDSCPADLKGDATKIIKKLAEFDPTENKSYVTWIVNRYKGEDFKIENKVSVRDTLSAFYNVKKKLTNQDILKYKSLAALQAALEQAKNTPVSAKQQQKAVKSDAEKIIDTPDFKVIVPKTEAASQRYGAGTNPLWCTAYTEQPCKFNEYNAKGPLYIIIAGSGSSAKKYQLHYETGEFNNDKNEGVSRSDIEYLSGFPAYKDFLNELIMKHYGPSIHGATK